MLRVWQGGEATLRGLELITGGKARELTAAECHHRAEYTLERRPDFQLCPRHAHS